jgi:hypothetical protein
MSIATYLAIAASWWGAHGYADQQPVAWHWGTCPYTDAQPGFSVYGCASNGYGGHEIELVRSQWDRRPRWSQCMTVLHEYGHAFRFAFRHSANDQGVMAEHLDSFNVPGACLGPPLYRRAYATVYQLTLGG